MDARAGGPWRSLRGGEIDARIELDLRLARRANAVAELHGQVARKMWKHLPGAAPIHAITNAIHVPTWVDPHMLQAAKTSGALLWKRHMANKRALLRFITARTGAKLDANVLLIAFSRRAHCPSPPLKRR